MFIQVAALLLLSLSVLAMYFTDLCYARGYYRAMLYINGGVFWLSLVVLVVVSVLLNCVRRRSRDFQSYAGNLRQFGLISFFKNKWAAAADIAAGLSLAGMCCFLVLEMQTQFWVFVFLSLFIFFFGMHCILNGINYRYVTYDKKGVESYEKGK